MDHQKYNSRTPSHKNLEKFRMHNDLTLQNLAEFLGVSRECVRRWEIGLNRPNIKNALKIEEITNGEVKARGWL